ncbi:Zinc metalloproteinase nas-8 [Orchesella cincta]|uniref:Zinc metalloproteinase nas-8 n=1 Tax=Orchesella cincta TaxID=48709 RepID=A0A1D2MDG8_ORCCI|nr:Zinc metalloproteinase nas-8 [Orchesella cincta]
MKRLFLICIIFQLSLIWEAACFPTENSIPAEPQLDSNAVCDNDRLLISNAAYWLGRVLPCVAFGVWGKGPPPTDYQDTYIHIKETGNGCSSHVGKSQIPGPQEMSLDPVCMTSETIMHQMIHALDARSKFDRLSSDEAKTFGIPYNTRSLMHASSYDHSRNGQPTILTKAGGIIANIGELQWTDIQKLMMMYQC